ncbi:hypothetical protein [Capsulimonas corticalis]|nr:hypothetical protein [Capsulimonas corticalis]
MILCVAFVAFVSFLLLIAPMRQLGAYFQREDKRLGGDDAKPRLEPCGALRRLKTFGALLRDENHPQHRPVVQIALLSSVVFLSVLMMAWIAARLR